MSKCLKITLFIAIISSMVLAATHPINYHSFEETVAKLEQFTINHPNLCQLQSIGKSAKGLDLWSLKISDFVQRDEQEPAVTLNATIHGNESIANEVSIKLIEYLLQQYQLGNPKISHLVNNTELYFLPIINPDGMVATTRVNDNGKDLNRSFPDGVDQDIKNIFLDPNFSTTGRQPETAALMRWHASKNFALSSCLHSGTVLIVYPYGNNTSGTNTYSASPDDALFIEISQGYVDGNPIMDSSHIKNGAVMYPITGEMPDWKYRFLGTLATTIELSKTKEPLDIALVWENNKQALINYLSVALQGFHGTVVDATSGDVINAKLSLINSSGHDFYTGDTGYFNRILQVGQYDIAIEAEGYHTKTITVTIAEDQLNFQQVMLEPISFTKSISSGWNQLSTAWPLTESVETILLPNPSKVWIWNGNDYQQTDLPEPGIAFWLFSESSREVIINDKPVGYTLSQPTLNLGWNLVGSSSYSRVNQLSSVGWAWNWQHSKYSPSKTMQRWNGYWIFIY